MAEKTWSDFYPEIRPHVYGCPTPTIDREIRNTCIEFFRSTSAYRHQLTDINLVAKQGLYTITTPAKTTMERVVEGYVKDDATADHRQIFPITIDELKDKYSNWRSQEGHPNHWVHDLNNLSILLFPIPIDAVTAGLRLWINLTPAQDAATGIEDYLYERYQDILASGTLARLMAAPNKRWSNPQEGDRRRRLYNAGKTRSTIEVFSSFTPTRLRTQPRIPLA